MRGCPVGRELCGQQSPAAALRAFTTAGGRRCGGGLAASAGVHMPRAAGGCCERVSGLVAAERKGGWRFEIDVLANCMGNAAGSPAVVLLGVLRVVSSSCQGTTLRAFVLEDSCDHMRKTQFVQPFSHLHKMSSHTTHNSFLRSSG